MNSRSHRPLVRYWADHAGQFGGQEVFSGLTPVEDLPRVIELIKDCIYMVRTERSQDRFEDSIQFQTMRPALVIEISGGHLVPIVGSALISKDRVRLYSLYPEHFNIEVPQPESFFERLMDLQSPEKVIAAGHAAVLRQLREDDGYTFSDFKMPVPVGLMSQLIHSRDQWRLLNAHDVPRDDRYSTAPDESLAFLVEPDSETASAMVYKSGERTTLRINQGWKPIGFISGGLQMATKYPVDPEHAEALIQRFDEGLVSRNLLDALAANRVRESD